jgi:hypothetical protein
VLLQYIETSSTALEELRKAGFTGNSKQTVADVLMSGVVPVPDHFPCSRACIQYGMAISRYILEKNGDVKA